MEMVSREFVVIDFEMTGLDFEHDEPVEVAYHRFWRVAGEDPIRPETFDTLIKPTVPIPPETSAIHHIIDQDVANSPSFQEVIPYIAKQFYNPNVIAVAHNSACEKAMVDRMQLGLDLKWLCTYKAALRVWPEARSHSNEGLRYFLGLGTGRSQRQNVHSAMHDVMVTTKILMHLLHHATVEEMLQWTLEPRLLPRCPIGKWRDYPWPEVDWGYLEWIVFKAFDMDPDIKWNARRELDRRASAIQKKHSQPEQPDEL